MGYRPFCLSQSRKLAFHEAGEHVLLQVEALASVRCVAEIRNSVTGLRTASVQGIKVSLAFNPVEFHNLGEQGGVLFLA